MIKLLNVFKFEAESRLPILDSCTGCWNDKRMYDKVTLHRFFFFHGADGDNFYVVDHGIYNVLVDLPGIQMFIKIPETALSKNGVRI